MNVLVDRHQAGLFHSMQLMARRFGWTLYTPIGHAWWDGEVWSFGRGTYPDDRLAGQYLMAAQEPDPEFPDWPIAFVTLEDAKQMDWAYIIATVQDNQSGFARFAREHGAQYVYEVGNTGQYIDWSLDPLVLSSSEMPILGRGIRVHQEMDPVAFVPPGEGRVHLRTAASFVNCMPQMGSCWDLLQGSGLSVDVYGINGPLDIIKPYSTLIELMGDYGWGWHDKQQGDGFGHVIHSWAAVGRPLVGHASHYSGKFAQHFWRDMETCIDLDRHSIEEAVELIRSISPSAHEAMCHAIRGEFDTIDYDAEAEMIAEFLGVRVTA